MFLWGYGSQAKPENLPFVYRLKFFLTFSTNVDLKSTSDLSCTRKVLIDEQTLGLENKFTVLSPGENLIHFLDHALL